MIEMIKLDDESYVPRECCTVTNPMTSGGKSEIDDIDMPCGADCSGECSECVVQKIMNEYAVLTYQSLEEAEEWENPNERTVEELIEELKQADAKAVVINGKEKNIRVYYGRENKAGGRAVVMIC